MESVSGEFEPLLQVERLSRRPSFAPQQESWKNDSVSQKAENCGGLNVPSKLIESQTIAPAGTLTSLLLDATGASRQEFFPDALLLRFRNSRKASELPLNVSFRKGQMSGQGFFRFDVADILLKIDACLLNR